MDELLKLIRTRPEMSLEFRSADRQGIEVTVRVDRRPPDKCYGVRWTITHREGVEWSLQRLASSIEYAINHNPELEQLRRPVPRVERDPFFLS